MTQFSNLTFKLAVINELMYVQEGLPPFTFHTVEAATGRPLYTDGIWHAPNDDYFGMLPEVREYFEKMTLTRSQLALVTTIRWDAGSKIQHDVAPNWDGEDDIFDFDEGVLKDLPLVPNLESVDALHDPENSELVEGFRERGITFGFHDDA